MIRFLCITVLLTLTTGACQQNKDTDSTPQGGDLMTIAVTSDAFEAEGMIPSKYTCDGPDVSPPLSWTGLPDSTKSLALIADDPDAPRGTWVHWVLYNLPPDTTGLPENVPPDTQLTNGARHGVTDFGRFGYGGPCPPGGTHRYYFKLYALDTVLDLSGAINKDDLLEAMESHILGEGQLMGRYKRQ